MVRLHLAEPLLEAVEEALAEHRAVEHRRVGRVADDGCLDAGQELLEEGVVDVVVDDRDAERGAALAGGAEAGEQRALGGEVEVGVGHHDERVLAAELEAGALQVAAAQLADAHADLGRAGEPDLVHQALLERQLQPLEGRRAVGVDGVEHARRAGRRRRRSRVSASPSAAAYSAGFQTTALPHSSAGTRYQDGTATGKLPAVMMPATPTGTRKVNSCLSRISLGTVWP